MMMIQLTMLFLVRGPVANPAKSIAWRYPTRARTQATRADRARRAVSVSAERNEWNGEEGAMPPIETEAPLTQVRVRAATDYYCRQTFGGLLSLEMGAEGLLQPYLLYTPPGI